MRKHSNHGLSEHVSGIIDSVFSFGLPDSQLFPLMRILGRSKDYAVAKYFDRGGQGCLAMKALCTVTGKPLASFVRNGAFFDEQGRSVETVICTELNISGAVLHDIIAHWDNASYKERSEALALLEAEGAAYVQDPESEPYEDVGLFFAAPFDEPRGIDNQLAEQVALMRDGRFDALTRAPFPAARTFETVS